MNNAYIFVWLSWIFWSITTFFLPKTNIRTALSIWFLLILITSSTFIIIHNYLIISLAFVTTLIGGIIIFSFQKRWLLNMIKMLIVACAYVTLLFMMKVSPVISFLPESLMIILLHVLIVIFLTHHYKARIAITILGSCIGESVYSFVLHQLYMVHIAGDYSFLSRLQIIIIILTVIQLLHEGRRQILLQTTPVQPYPSLTNDRSIRL